MPDPQGLEERLAGQSAETKTGFERTIAATCRRAGQRH